MMGDGTYRPEWAKDIQSCNDVDAEEIRQDHNIVVQSCENGVLTYWEP